QVRERVETARSRQLTRSGMANARLDNTRLEQVCPLEAEPARLLQTAISRLGLSARAYHRVLKLARTIADLAGAEQISTAHISEAIGYRKLDRPLQQLSGS
ncbi:MAG: YifB family Mg chelatase-like AAA ATPase, partial [Pseudomonadota bacterium]